MIETLVLVAALAAPQPGLAEAYLERYFAFYPSRATAAGRHDRDAELEDFSGEAIASWVAYNREVAGRLRERLAAAGGARHDVPGSLDQELLLRQTEEELASFDALERHRTNPLFWTRVPANATVFLLVRDDLPRKERLTSAAARAAEIPRLAAQARETLGAADAARIAPELAEIAAGQTRASATFYREGFARVGEGEDEELAARLTAAGASAASALDSLAAFLDELAAKASGSPRLGEEAYRLLFRLHTGLDDPPGKVAAEAEAALAAKRAEAAGYAREIWGRYFPEAEPPADGRALLARMFDRVEEDHAASVDEFVADYRELVAEAVAFVRERGVVTMPGELTLHIDRSPSYFVGQSVGGVYPAGPYAPEADTLFYLPTPPDSATPAEREAFFRDFNHHFNVMITPHEIVPGHYLQIKHAARGPSKVRALFGDGVFVEGWGTFCERLMLDLGWGDPLARLAHLKKQMENIARTVVDVRVHTGGMEREEVLRFVREEALQDEQFAGNMWTRAVTSSPQLTSYWLGYRRVMGLYEEVRAARGEAFELRELLDGMMELGPVPVRHHRERLLGAPEAR